jgi:16S rRNA (adenine1518-N6/adenine1519-N6)-dimethyltransferase
MKTETKGGYPRAKKRFGQNFLSDGNVLEKIVTSARITPDTGVIEIGSGTGYLTERLLRVAPCILAYEIDRDLVKLLKARFSDLNRFILIPEDVLKRNLETDIKEHLSGVDDIVLVSNLPYYITTPILMMVLEKTRSIQRMVMMMQLEVARRITSEPGTKDYGALSVIIRYIAEPKLLFKVSRNAFRPVPDVDSAVVSIEIRRERPLEAEAQAEFFHFVHQAFAHRRKTLMNNMLSAYPTWERTDIEQAMQTHGIPVSARAETLHLQAFLDLYIHYTHTRH